MNMPPHVKRLSDRLMALIWRETGFPVIICDPGGVIVGAVEKKRIGTVHAGAVRIMSGEVDEYAVSSDEALRNALVREGYSCPIQIDGKRVGTFGVTGPLSLSKPIARLSSLIITMWVREVCRQELVGRSLESVFASIRQLGEKTGEMDGRFRTLLAEMKHAAKQIGEKAGGIEKILDGLHRISQHSHILSMNGAVEATRVGEAGKAFLVVAHEMAQLSLNTRATTDDIQKLLEEMTECTARLAGAILASENLAAVHTDVMEHAHGAVSILKTAATDLEAMITQEGADMPASAMPA